MKMKNQLQQQIQAHDNQRKTKHFRILAWKQIAHKLQTTQTQNNETPHSSKLTIFRQV